MCSESGLCNLLDTEVCICLHVKCPWVKYNFGFLKADHLGETEAALQIGGEGF